METPFDKDNWLQDHWAKAGRKAVEQGAQKKPDGTSGKNLAAPAGPPPPSLSDLLRRTGRTSPLNSGPV